MITFIEVYSPPDKTKENSSVMLANPDVSKLSQVKREEVIKNLIDLYSKGITLQYHYCHHDTSGSCQSEQIKTA